MLTILSVIFILIGFMLFTFLVNFSFRLINKIARLVWRILAKVAASIIIVAIVTTVLAYLFLGIQGNYQNCLVCNKGLEKTTYSGIVTLAQEETDSYSYYEKWYQDNIGLAHQHDWLNIYYDEGYAFYEILPRIPDKPTAVLMAKRMITSTHNERLALLQAFKSFYNTQPKLPNDLPMEDKAIMEEGKPWKILYEQKELKQEDFIKYYKTWLKYHPEWQ
jgi:hypothetical protein